MSTLHGEKERLRKLSQARNEPGARAKNSSAEVRQIGSRRELFVDYYLIEQMKNTSLRLHEPKEEGTVLLFDNPWGGPFSAYVTVIKEGGRFRLYYRGSPTAPTAGDDVTCYAESEDGFHWTKPDLNLFKVQGTYQNNVILVKTPAVHNFSPFLDRHPQVNPEQKYKALGGADKSGLIAYTSPDGIHWKKLQAEPVITRGIFDSQNVSFWSESENCYLCYFRTWTGGGYNGFRSVSRTTSPDFIHWTKPVEMNFGDTPGEHLYINQTHPYFRAVHIYVAIAARFMPGRQVLTEEQAAEFKVDPQYFKDCSEAVLMTSRGGNLYDRTFMEGFISPGLGLENWVSRTNYPALNVVQTGTAEMSLYVRHNYAQPTACLSRYSLRLDGFASVTAPYEGGEMITKLLTFTGKELFINFRTSAAGEIRLEIQDLNGKPLPGYSLKDSQIIIGNEIERVVSWKRGSNVEELSGKPIRLRLVMKDADLFSLRFASSPLR